MNDRISNFTAATQRPLVRHSGCGGLVIASGTGIVCLTCERRILDRSELTGHPRPDLVREPRPWSRDAREA